MSNTPAIQTTATTIQGQFLEVAIALQNAVDNVALGVDYVQIDPDIVTGLITITAIIPSNITLSEDEIRIKATDIYPLSAGAG